MTPYRRVDSLAWTDAEMETGKMVHLKKFPKGHQVKLFRIALSTQRTDYVVTNDLLKIRRMLLDKKVPSVGRLSSFIVKPNRLLGLNRVNVVRNERSGIILLVPCWSGFVSMSLLKKHRPIFTN